jgi:hypothetical protein
MLEVAYFTASYGNKIITISFARPMHFMALMPWMVKVVLNWNCAYTLDRRTEEVSMADDVGAAVDSTPLDKTKRQRPTKPLPTDRIAFPKQLDILRAYAVAHETTGRPVTNAEIGNIVKMAASTVPHANSFFSDPEIGLLIKAEGGHVPSPAVIAFHRAFAWNPEAATHKFAPAFQAMWFSQVLMPRLAFRSMEEREAIRVLAEACGATPEYESQLSLVLAFLEAAGMIEREGGQVRAIKSVGPAIEPAVPAVALPEVLAPPTRGLETTFVRPTTGDGVHFNLSIDVDMKEMATWAPDRIAAFFAGFAQVLAAKGALEKNAAKE